MRCKQPVTLTVTSVYQQICVDNFAAHSFGENLKGEFKNPSIGFLSASDT